VVQKESKEVIRHSIKRLRTPKKGQSKFELRLTTGHGKDTKKLTRRFDSREECKQFVEDEEKRIQDEKKAQQELRALGITEDDIRTWDTEVAYWNTHNAPTISNAWKQTTDAFAREVLPFLTGKSVYTEIKPELIDDIVAFLRTVRPLKDKDGNTVRMKKPDSPKTLWLKVSWIQSVLNFSVSKRRLRFSPIATYEKEKVPETEIEFWEKAEAEDFFRAMNEKYPPDSEFRWRYAAYLTKLNSSLRTGELLALKPETIRRSISQFYLKEQIDKVTGELSTLKGKKARSVPMNEDVLRELDHLIKSEKIKSEQLIFSNRGKPIGRKAFYTMAMRDILEWGGRTISPHGLRHTGATLFLLAGVDIRTLQKILGHTDIKTTERYAHVVNSSITAAASKLSVGGRKRETSE
jgi:integrase/recombinase XerD